MSVPLSSPEGTRTRQDLLDVVTQIARHTAGPAAPEVDRDARFPQEAIDALRREHLLSAAVPRDLGGFGCSVRELGAMCEALGQHCAATAMVFAMHHIQVASLARHAASSAYLREYLASLVTRQSLISSVTSEVGVGGHMRSSCAAIETAGDRFALRKEATTISYGVQADDLLITARRAPGVPSNDQVLVLAHRADCSLEQTGDWDTFGMRGTCSPGFRVEAVGSVEQIIPAPFADVATQTMVPYSHLLWCSAWAGIAKSAVAQAGRFVRADARKNPGSVPPTALRLAEVSGLLQLMQQGVQASCSDFENLMAAPSPEDALSTLGFALQMNNLKVTSSQMVAQIVTQCLGICGIQGYKNNSPFSLGRQLRDAHSAALMIGNDRILHTNASLLLVHKDY